MSNRKFNLILAEYAVTYVEAIMSKGLGPSNRMESIVHRLELSAPPLIKQGPSPARKFYEIFGAEWDNKRTADIEARDRWPTDLKEKLSEKKSEIIEAVSKQRIAMEAKGSATLFTGPIDDQSRERAALGIGVTVEQSGMGNCGEQSCVAFKYLITRGAPGLAIMNWPDANHTFVVIGMDASVPRFSTASLTIPPLWGLDAVVCDPWYHEWFAVESLIDWQSKMKRILADAKSTPAYRIERDAAAAKGKQEGYAKVLLAKWQFSRLAYLAHGNPALTSLACGGNALRASAQNNLDPLYYKRPSLNS